MDDVQELARRILGQERRAVARGLTWIESGSDQGRELVQTLFPEAGRAHVIGITGAPGVGKSTLVNQLALALRRGGQRVGILAVDPSSPYSGGAILGDRIRMQESVMDHDVFMRSLANRGHLGGLSRATFGAVTLMDAGGYDVILIETVGAGQSEVEIMKLAQTTVVVLAPGLGDDIQAIKAGILEIGQIFVVNKADRDGADHSVREIRGMLNLGLEHPDWYPPILKTVAERGDGVNELVEAIGQHYRYLAQSGSLERLRQAKAAHLIDLALEDWVHQAFMQFQHDADWERWREEVLAGRQDAETVAKHIVSRRLLP